MHAGQSRSAVGEALTATKSSSSSRGTDADDAPKPTLTRSEQRARILLLAALSMLLLLYCITHDWRRAPLVVPGGRKAAPPLSLVPRSPLPGSSALPRAPVIAQHGLSVYSLPLSLVPGIGGARPTAAAAQSFAVYVPASVPLAAASGGAARVPLVVLLPARDSSMGAEVESRIEEAERSRHVLLCPSLLLPHTWARAQSVVQKEEEEEEDHGEEHELMDRAVDFIAAAIDSVMDIQAATATAASGGAIALGRFLDPSSVQLRSRSDGASAWLSFLLQRPNYWTSAACRSCKLQGRYYAERGVVEPWMRMTQLALHAPDTAASAPESGPGPSPTPESSAAFWTRYFQDRTVLLETDSIESRGSDPDTDALESLLRHSFGFQRLQRRLLTDEPLER